MDNRLLTLLRDENRKADKIWNVKGKFLDKQEQCGRFISLYLY